MTHRPYLLTPEAESRGHGAGRLAGIMHVAVPSSIDTLVHRTQSRPGWTLTTLDISTRLSLPAMASPTIVHILWTRSDRGTEIVIGPEATPDDAPLFILHPGDTMIIPDRMAWSVERGAILQVLQSGLPGHATLAQPSHGLSVFDRFNRRTVCAVMSDLALDRWKLTGPQTFDFNNPGWQVFCNLVEPTGLVWSGGMLNLDRLAVCVVPPDIGSATIVPDGLGYVTHAYVPDLERDVFEPFRRAGFDRAAMARVPGLTNLS